MVKSNTSLFSMCFPLRKVRKRKLNQRKNMRSNSSNMSIPQGQHHPSCMWGIFHVLKYHRWNRRFIKKRISSKKQDAGAEEVSNKNADDSSKHMKAEAPGPNSRVEGKRKSPGTGCKASVTSRLKALITDKGKGNHQRSSSYPIQSKSDPDNQVEHLPDMEQTHGSRPRADKNKGICNASCAEDQAVWEECASSDENYQYCSPWTCWGKEKVDENTKTLLESAILSREELDVRKKAVHEYSNDRDGPGYESKYLMDALDIIKLNQGFLLTVLQDPDSPLARHFHKQLAMDAKIGMSHFESFPSISRGNQSPDGTWFDGKGKEVDVSSNGEKPGDYESADDFCRKSMPMIAKDHRGEGIHILNQAQAKLADISSSPSSHDLNRSEMARNRFKCLSENLRYVIEERSKERHRIAMDAVLDKIPHQKGFSKDLPPDIVDLAKDPARRRKLLSSCSAREQKTSFNESMDRYAQLFEHSCSKESKEESISKSIRGRREEPFESRRSRKKSMRRILSSPELYSAAYLREAFPYSPDMSTHVDEHKFLQSVALGYSLEVDNFEDNSFQHFSDHLSQVKKSDDEPEDSTIITDNISQSEQDSKHETMPITKMEELSSEGATGTSAESSNLQDMELSQSFGLSDDLQQESKNTLKMAGGGVIELQLLEDLKKDLDTIDKQEFRYVKDVLELAGFSGDEALGAWHAEKQPLDPMMYEEIRGCSICDPNCSTEGEEVGYCNHPLLFALINEVLLDVYERSHSYYPRALSHLCHLRPMPAGRHVLEQVWERISWFLSFKTGYDKPLDYVAGRDLMGDDRWMSLQTEHETLALEIEDLIFTDLLQDLSSST